MTRSLNVTPKTTKQLLIAISASRVSMLTCDKKLTVASSARGVSQIAIDNWWSSLDHVARDTRMSDLAFNLSQMILQKC